MVWRLDRLGRSLKELVHRVEELQQKGIGFRGLQEVIDTTSATDKLGFHAFSAMAEFERKLIRERTLAGLRAALAGADLHVPSGGITGLLGPRGGVGAGGSHGTAMRHVEVDAIHPDVDVIPGPTGPPAESGGIPPPTPLSSD